MTTSTRVWILFLVNTNVNLLMGGIHYSWRLRLSQVETNISHNGSKSVMNYIMGPHVFIATSTRFHYGLCFIFFHLLFIVWLPWRLQKGRTFWRGRTRMWCDGLQYRRMKKRNIMWGNLSTYLLKTSCMCCSNMMEVQEEMTSKKPIILRVFMLKIILGYGSPNLNMSSSQAYFADLNWNNN